MKKWLILILIIIVAGFSLAGYNSLVQAEEKIDLLGQMLNLNTNAVADLIPNLVNTVKGHKFLKKKH